MVKKISIAILGVTLWASGMHDVQAAGQDLELSEAWVRALPPGMGMTAAFGNLVNRGDSPITLAGFTSEEFADVSLHNTTLVDGVSRMREVHDLTLQPGESLEMKPGGYHLMLMKPMSEVGPGDTVHLEVNTGTGSGLTFELSVQKR